VTVGVVRSVRAEGFEKVLQVVGDEVEAHEDEEDGHAEAGDDLGALKAEGMADRAPFPDLEIAEDVDADADGGADGVEEDEVGEGG